MKAGIAVGTIAGLTSLIVLGLYLYQRRQSKYPEADDERHHYILRRELSDVCEKQEDRKFVYLVNRHH
jgi:hypothetical protein